MRVDIRCFEVLDEALELGLPVAGAPVDARQAGAAVLAALLRVHVAALVAQRVQSLLVRQRLVCSGNNQQLQCKGSGQTGCPHHTHHWLGAFTQHPSYIKGFACKFACASYVNGAKRFFFSQKERTFPRNESVFAEKYHTTAICVPGWVEAIQFPKFVDIFPRPCRKWGISPSWHTCVVFLCGLNRFIRDAFLAPPGIGDLYDGRGEFLRLVSLDHLVIPLQQTQQALIVIFSSWCVQKNSPWKWRDLNTFHFFFSFFSFHFSLLLCLKQCQMKVVPKNFKRD